jgi:hypothetical protein
MSTTQKNALMMVLGLSAAFLLFARSKRSSIENFGMIPAQVAVVDKVVQTPKTGDFYSVPGTYQALLQPKQAGMVDYGAFIRYNPPPVDKRGESMGSLNYASMQSQNAPVIVENYDLPSSMVQSSAKQQPSASSFVTPLGQPISDSDQPIIYDRYVFANQKDRLRQDADFIRGDLPITPLTTGWFTPSANPQTALRTGALAVMGGVNNDTSKQLLAMKSALARTQASNGGGINYSVQSSPYTSAAGGDVTVTRFP